MHWKIDVVKAPLEACAFTFEDLGLTGPKLEESESD